MSIVTCGGTHPNRSYDLVVISARPFLVYVIIAVRCDLSPQAASTTLVVFPEPAEAMMTRLLNGTLNIVGDGERLFAVKYVKSRVSFVFLHVFQQ